MKKAEVVSWLKNNWLLILIIITGSFVRIYEFGDIPPGLNQDEISAGYDAWSIYEYGMDRNGYHYPAIFQGFGAGQNSLHQYLSIPFIALFGLNVYSVRALDLVFGLIALIVFYLFVKEVLNKPIAIFATFLLAICPWHIILSHWGTDENLFPVFFLIGNLFLVYSLKKQIYLPLSFLFFALTLYGHNVAYFVVPAFVVLSSIYLIAHKKVKLRIFLLSAAVFGIVALPVLGYILINTLNLDPISTPFFSIPKVTYPTFKQSLIFDDAFSNITPNFNEFINVVIKQNCRLPDGLPPYGFIYSLSMPLALIGLVILAKNLKTRLFDKIFFVLLWLSLALILCLLIKPLGNRISIIFFPLIILTSVGALFVKDKINTYLFYLIIVLYLLLFAAFSQVYFTEYPSKIGPEFFESFGETIIYAMNTTKGPICITNTVNMPYIYILFNEKTDPNKFIETIEYYDPAAMWQGVKRFDRYYFGPEGCKLANRPSVFVLNKKEAESDKKGQFMMKNYTNYVVAVVAGSN